MARRRMTANISLQRAVTHKVLNSYVGGRPAELGRYAPLDAFRMVRRGVPVIFAALLLGCDVLTSPATFDDCILQNMKGATSDVAAASIRSSCMAKFPKPVERAPAFRALTPAELSRVTGRAGPSYGINYYSGSMYNGNESITITEITLNVTTTISGEKVTRKYSSTVRIPPSTTADFGFDIIVGDSGAKYNWDIADAKGY
jgi:hypothetical protein